MERIKELVLSVPLTVQSEMTACVAVLALSGELSGPLFMPVRKKADLSR